MAQNLQLAQLIAYVCLTLSSIVVAVVSLTFTYRQNYGRRPLISILRSGVHGRDIAKFNDVAISLDFWNRRSYPVVIQRITIKSGGLVFAQVNNEDQKWMVWSDRLILNDQIIVAASYAESFIVTAPLKNTHAKDINNDITVEAKYYDPRRNKELTTISCKRVKPSMYGTNSGVGPKITWAPSVDWDFSDESLKYKYQANRFDN